MKRLLFSMLFAAIFFDAIAYDFSAVSPSGHTLYYNIVNGHAEVVRPGTGSNYNNYVTGDLIIPSSVTYNGTNYAVTAFASYNYIIDDGPFYNCSGLTSVTIPSSVTSIGNFAFYGCSGLTSVTIPSSVTSIGKYAFYGCSGLTSVTIPSSVTSIGGSAFEGCSGLTSVTIPSSVTSIGERAFYGCSGLTSVTIPSSVTSIGNFAFYGCSGLTSITIPSGITSIDFGTFSGCSGLTSISIPTSVTTIDVGAFSGCTGLTSVTIPSSVITIDNFAFQECSGLTSVTIPPSITSIGVGAFYNCNGLTSVTIPSSVTSIGNYAFSNVRHIEYYGSATGSPWGAMLMNGVIDGVFVFSDSTKHFLQAYIGADGDVAIPTTVDTIGSKTFYDCSSLTSVTIPSSVTLIGDSAFSGCSSLTSVSIPSGVISIGSYAFCLCSSLTSVTIPSSVTSIGTSAFIGCTGMTVMWLKPTVPPSLGTWSSINSNTHVVVPRNAYSAYLSADHYTGHFIYRDTVCVAVIVNDTVRGRVVGYDSVCPYPAYLDTITVMAISNHGYHFNRWENNDTCSVRRLTNITGDVFLTAYFDKNKYTIYANADTSIHGYINAPAHGNYLDEVAITAHASHGYHFTHWQDGDTNNPRTITLTQDTSFIAMFANNQYMVIGITSDSIKGIVSGSTTANYLDSVTLSATANYGFHFLRWSDYNTSNPRKVVVTDDISLTALWGYNQYSITLLADTSIHGAVIGSGAYNYLSERAIGATANHGYHFTHWQDGDTNNPRTFILTQDTQFVAYYDKNVYTLTFQSDNTDMGIVNTTSVSSEYLDTTMQIYATAIPHHHFVRWDDNNTENLRRFVFDDNRTYTAYFAIDEHTVDVQVDNLAHGTVDGAGTREYGQPATVSATPYSGYQFAHWSDGSTYNPYTFAVLEDKSLTAIFIADGEPWQDTVVVYDTAYITLHDTTYINVPVHDTTFIAVHDTAYINVLVHDTTYINVPVHDTTYITVTDTLTVTQYDTVTNTVYDTIDNYIHDTVTVTDTLWLTQIDTLWLHDTIIIHDTVYITQEGISDVDALNVKVYTSQGQIVVEGANGNTVVFYDVNGRMLATKRDEYAPLRFDAPVSGTYLIKIGNYPARKVVVIS